MTHFLAKGHRFYQNYLKYYEWERKIIGDFVEM
jgi:hypothetical protein